MIVGTHGQDEDPAYCQATPLPFDDSVDQTSFAVTKPSWWQDYYSLSTTLNETRRYIFKVYPGRPSDIIVFLYRKEYSCPQPQGATNAYDERSFGLNSVASMIVDRTAPSFTLFYVRAIGLNYTFVGGLNGSVIEYCPSDCNQHGYCDVATTLCQCHDGYDGPACGQIITPPKIPLGSWATYYGVVIGVPLLGAALIAGLTTIVVLIRRRKTDAHQYSKLPVHSPINSTDANLVDIQDINIVQSR